MAGRSAVKNNRSAVVLLLTLAAWGSCAAGPAEATLVEVKQAVYAEASIRLADLGQITDGDGNLERLYLSPAHKRAAHKIQGWMNEIGLHTSLDGVANVRGRLHGKNPDKPAWLMGSHYDTVVDGGFFDGALGIIAAIAAVKALILEAALGQAAISESHALSIANGQKTLQEVMNVPVDTLLPGPLEIIAFSEEEGLRFQSTFLASQAVTGSLATSGLLEAKDAQGTTLMEVLQQEGLAQSPLDLAKSSIKPGDIQGYVEVHMEQGPVLEALGTPLGVVTAIAGQSRLAVTMQGMQGHAGTVPMPLRRDPMAGAAEAIHQIEQICNGGPRTSVPGPFAEDTSLVCTVGSLTAWPGSSNVIPGAVNFTIDIRSQHDDVRGRVVREVQQNVATTCSQRQLQCSVELRNEVEAVPCDTDIVQQLAAAAAAVQGAGGSSAAGLAVVPPAVPRLVSGAGHDAMAMATITKMGMLFVRCVGGISHSSLENVTNEDVSAAVAALHSFLQHAIGEARIISHEEL